MRFFAYGLIISHDENFCKGFPRNGTLYLCVHGILPVEFASTHSRVLAPQGFWGIKQCTKCVAWRRRDRGGINTHAKHCPASHCLIFATPRKIHKDVFSFLVLFNDEKYQKSHKVVPALCILPASSHHVLFKQPSPSGANIASEPSNRNLSTATGSKRSNADSDLLLCHVRLRQTSRFRFGCASGCEHSEMGFITVVPSAHLPKPRPPHLYMRACRQCVHESARLSRVICSHAW